MTTTCELRKPRETSVRFVEPGDGSVRVSVVISPKGGRTRALLQETSCRDMGEALEYAQDVLDWPDTKIEALPYAFG